MSRFACTFKLIDNGYLICSTPDTVLTLYDVRSKSNKIHQEILLEVTCK